MLRQIPQSFAPLFWFLDYRKLDLDKDRHLIVHQVLSLGTLNDLKQLLRLYGPSAVRKEFKKPKSGLYQPNILAFCQFILKVKKLNKQRYLKNIYAPTSRSIGSR